MERTPDGVEARPPLGLDLDGAELRDWYWTLAELRAFCRAQGWPSGGRKAEVTDRIAAMLDGCAPAAPASRAVRGRRVAMPEDFDDETIIGPGWRCTQALRAHLRGRLGPTFSFTGPVRAFIATEGVGSPLREVEDVWRRSRSSRPSSVEEIEPVFEYNRFRHRYRAEHPSASGAEIGAAWRQWRATRASARPPAPPG